MLRTDHEKPAEIKKQETLNRVFPLGIPPKDVVDGTYVINDETLCFDQGFHQTDSSILLFPRPDRRLLVPAAALGEGQPTLHLGV